MRPGFRSGIAAVAVVYLVVAHDRGSEGRAQSAPPPAPAVAAAQTPGATVTPQRALINEVTVSLPQRPGQDRWPVAGDFDPDAAGQHAEIAEKVIPQALRGGLMPPAGARRPDGQAAAGVRLVPRDQARRSRTRNPAPGRVPLRRLNRREYQYAVRDLLGLNIDATAWLPDDNVKGNFDNNAAARIGSLARAVQYRQRPRPRAQTTDNRGMAGACGTRRRRC